MVAVVVLPGSIGDVDAVMDGVVQLRSETVDVAAVDAESLVHDDAGELLALTSRRHPGLPRVDHEALVGGDRRDRIDQPPRPTAEGVATGEGEVVGVSRIDRVEGPGESGEPDVETPCHEVGDER